jgi:hypothetical protein
VTTLREKLVKSGATDRGRTVDLHALRHTFGTHLSNNPPYKGSRQQCATPLEHDIAAIQTPTIVRLGTFLRAHWAC